MKIYTDVLGAAQMKLWKGNKKMEEKIVTNHGIRKSQLS